VSQPCRPWKAHLISEVQQILGSESLRLKLQVSFRDLPEGCTVKRYHAVKILKSSSQPTYSKEPFPHSRKPDA